MSHASLVNAATGDKNAWKQHSRLSLAGTSDTAMPFFLNQHKSVRELVFCLDNDTAGREAAAIMARKYAYKGYTALNELPRGKTLTRIYKPTQRKSEPKNDLNRHTGM